MIRGIVVTCILAVFVVCASSLPAMCQTNLTQDNSSYSAAGTLDLVGGDSPVSLVKSSSSEDDSSKLKWGLSIAGACAAIGAFSGFGSSGSDSGGNQLDGIVVDVPDTLAGDVDVQEDAAAPVATPAVPDAPSALLFLIGIPGIIRIVCRKR